MKEKLTQLLQEGQEKIRAARSEGELQEVKGLLLGKQGALDAGEDGFVPYGCIVSEGKVPAVVGTGEVPVFAIIAPELLEGIGSPLRELLGSVCAAA